jgi:hypothetical protein
MSRIQQLVLSMTGAALLLVGLAAPAAAAPPNPSLPDAVTVTAFGTGKKVTIQVTNNYSAPLTLCGVFLFLDPNVPHAGSPVDAWGPVDLQPGKTREHVVEMFPMFNGNYHVYWNCTVAENNQTVWWGTAPHYQAADAGWTPTATPPAVIVDTPTCLGSVCFPQGFGI